jgi:alpha-tubulin suppressor-like RCC1 family protein
LQVEKNVILNLKMKKIFFAIMLALCSHISSAQCWIDVAAGSYHCLSISPDSTLWAWGYPLLGVLGDGSTNKYATPTQINNQHIWKSVSAGNKFSLALRHDGTIWAWGAFQCGDTTYGYLSVNFREFPIQVGSASDWKAICASSNGLRCYAIKNDGTLWGWGSHTQFAPIGNSTVPYGRLATPVQIGISNNWASVVSSGGHTLALQTDGSLWGWGYNDFGQCGIGSTITTDTPTKIGADSWTRISVISSHTSYGIKTDGSLWAWGTNGFFNALGTGTSSYAVDTPSQVGSATNWVEVVAGADFALAINANADCWAWGRNLPGNQLDSTLIQPSSYATPRLVGNYNLTKMSAGDESTVNGAALLPNGDVFNWGQLVRSSSIFEIVGCFPLSLDFEKVESLKVSPNPSTGHLQINVMGANVYIKDVYGKVVQHHPNCNGLLDVSQLPAGTYVITTQASSKFYFTRFIKL